jgi:hypothetical protein
MGQQCGFLGLVMCASTSVRNTCNTVFWFANSIHTVCLILGHCILVVAQGLQQLEPAIMDKLLWPSVPMLTSVHLQEEVARRARDALSGCILASLTPVRRYAQHQEICFLGCLPQLC